MLRAGQSGALTRESETVDGASSNGRHYPDQVSFSARRAEPSRIGALCVSCWRSAHILPVLLIRGGVVVCCATFMTLPCVTEEGGACATASSCSKS